MESANFWLAAGLIAFLSYTSFWHVFRNAFVVVGEFSESDADKSSSELNPIDHQKFCLHKIAVCMFATFAATYAIPAWTHIAGEALFIAALVVIIHVSRATLDFADGSSPTSKRELFSRHAVDALANFSTLMFAAAVFARRAPLFGYLALWLSVGLVGKELVYRLWLDTGVRRQSERKTTQGGAGSPSSEQFQAYHAISNGLKSLAYFLLGYACIYSSLATISPGYYRILIFGKSESDRFYEVFAFSARNVKLLLEGEFDPLLALLTVLEFVGVTFFGIWISKSPVQRS